MRPTTTRQDGFYVVVCRTDGRPWVLARVINRDDSCPFFFTYQQAVAIADEITFDVADTEAQAVEWVAADIAHLQDRVDVAVARALRDIEIGAGR